MPIQIFMDKPKCNLYTEMAKGATNCFLGYGYPKRLHCITWL